MIRRVLATAVLFHVWFVAAVFAGQVEVLAREGKGRLERQDGRLVLYVSGTPYEMGFQHGRLLPDLVRKNFDAVLDNRGKIGESTEYQAYKVLAPGMHFFLRRHVPERFREEMKGLAEGSGLPYDRIEAGNLFPEAFHCSGMALMGKATKDGSLYHVRILDYMTEAGLQETALVIIHEPEGGHRWMNVGFAGFIGSVTGMNDAQVTIGEMGGRGLASWNGMPMAFLVRDALERAGTLEEAVSIFRETPRTCEYYYVISDAKIPDARAVWATHDDFETAGPGERFGFVRVGKPPQGAADGKAFVRGSQVVVEPHRILIEDSENDVEGFIALQPENCVVVSGPDRYQHFVDRLLPRYGEVDESLLMEMVKRPVAMRSNLHCAIFHPATLEAWVAIAAPDGSPACDQPYARYSLAPQDGGTARD
ncbi:MAG: peptidase C45 [Planctomycetes bacterium]|nr:peptidase C45 [Planctomycetota bacterium]